MTNKLRLRGFSDGFSLSLNPKMISFDFCDVIKIEERKQVYLFCLLFSVVKKCWLCKKPIKTTKYYVVKHGMKNGKISLFTGKDKERTVVWALLEEIYCSKDCLSLSRL
jgi:hypothetical protein